MSNELPPRLIEIARSARDVAQTTSDVAQNFDILTRAFERSAERIRDEEPRSSRKRLDDRQKALSKSEKLLHSFLTDRQKYDLENHGRFWVESQFGNTYTIFAMWFWSMENRKINKQYCLAPNNIESFPIYDGVLVNVLLLKYNEKRFLELANVEDIYSLV